MYIYIYIYIYVHAQYIYICSPLLAGKTFAEAPGAKFAFWAEGHPFTIEGHPLLSKEIKSLTILI